MATHIKLGGTVDAGFTAVREAFAANLEAEEELGASFAVVLKGECVVDLWGGYADRRHSRPWQADTLVNVWSTTKGLVALAIALLVDTKQLNYETRVAEIWPEFGTANKTAITVGQLLSHQAGLCGPTEPTVIEDFYDWDRIIRRLERQEPIWAPGSACGYHRLTFGHLAGELICRLTGKTAHQYLSAAVAAKVGAEVHIGVPEPAEPRVAEIEIVKAAPDMPIPAYPHPAWFAKANPPLDPALPNTRAWRAAEIPGANGHSNALSLARMFGALALDGFLSRRTIERATSLWFEGNDLVLNRPVSMGAGFFINSDFEFGPNPLSFGHAGWGGSYVFFDPALGMSVGYAMNRMIVNGDVPSRTQRLLRALYAAL